jgi:2-keto-4-pentenoate hydratase/2-oxohepta-3-ene-1,7-dioic acid hydratase in catechol pathway
MRIASALSQDHLVFGPVIDDTIRDVSAAVADPNALVALVHTEEGRAQVAGMGAAAPRHDLASVTLLPPVPQPRRIMCVGTNYADHIAESDRVQEAPPYPVIFTRFASSLVGHGSAIERSAASTSYDYEGELAIVIGARTRHISPEDALSAIAGYSCFMDGTMRDFQRHTSQFIPGKNFERSGAFGPFLVTADEITDPYALELSTTVDGAVVQHASTSQLIHNLSAIVSYCSTFTTLEPGDVIATGTPGGVGYVKEPPLWLVPGTEVRVTVPGVGELVNRVIDAA